MIHLVSGPIPATPSPTLLPRPTLRPLADDELKIPPLRGPLRVYREDLDRIWAILSRVEPDLELRVRVGDHEYQADSLEALDPLLDECIDQIEIRQKAQRISLEIRRDQKLLYAAIPFCTGWVSDGNLAERREALRHAMSVLEPARRKDSWLGRIWVSLVVIVPAPVALIVATWLLPRMYLVPAYFVIIAMGVVLAFPFNFSMHRRQRRTEIHAGYRRQYLGWWRRHRDQAVPVISAVIGAVVGAGLTALLVHLTSH